MQILASTLLTAIAPRQSATTQTVYQLKIRPRTLNGGRVNTLTQS
ncbi:hypothetical protein [Leptolyngbya sp. FACHB-671]|nr:hypothetical protein [Leptolyngbya sp. FACHB-671]